LIESAITPALETRNATRQPQTSPGKTFDPPGIDDDVLAGGEKCHKRTQAKRDHHGFPRIAGRLGQYRQRQRQLHGDQPAPPSAEKQRPYFIEHRRPDEFEQIGETNIGGESDQPQPDMVGRHPQPQSGAGERPRQARGKSQQRHQPEVSRLTARQPHAGDEITDGATD
jgi:hypothetical protein